MMLFAVVSSIFASVAVASDYSEDVLMHNANGYTHHEYGRVCEWRQKELVYYHISKVSECLHAFKSMQRSCFYDPTDCDMPVKFVYQINSPNAPTGCFFTNVGKPKLWFNVNRNNAPHSRAKPFCSTTEAKVMWQYGQRKTMTEIGGKLDTGCKVCESWDKSQYRWLRMDREFGTDSFLVECGESCVGDKCYKVGCHNTEASKNVGANFDDMLGVFAADKAKWCIEKFCAKYVWYGGAQNCKWEAEYGCGCEGKLEYECEQLAECEFANGYCREEVRCHELNGDKCKLQPKCALCDTGCVPTCVMGPGQTGLPVVSLSLSQSCECKVEAFF